MISVFIYYFWYVFSMVQGIDVFTAIFFTGEHIFIKVVTFILITLCFVFSIYTRDNAVKIYKEAKSQNEK